MSPGNWLEEIVGDRIAVDRAFHERVQRSSFSNQQWELIMMATEFEIEQPSDPGRAKIVADTSRLPDIAPELDSVESEMGVMAGGTPRSEGAETGSGGPIDSLKNLLGIGGNGVDQERLDEAGSLVAAYAEKLQHRLESRGKWERVREQAATSAGNAVAEGDR